MWGLSVLFWPLLAPASAIEVLLHRVVWAFVFVSIIMTAARLWPHMRRLPLRTWLLVAAAGALNAANWGLFIFAVLSQQIVGASMAYFLNPIASATIGMVFLSERMRVTRVVALGIGLVAVVVTGVASSGNPLLPLLMASCFGFYALVQRVIPLGAVETLAGESGLLTPLAIAGLVLLQVTGSATLVDFGVAHVLLFVAGGLVTLLPLLAFGGAARRVPLSTMAVMQYVAPIIQFVAGVFIAREPMPAARWLGFGLVLLAVVVFTTGELARRRPRELPDLAPEGA
jgi:chloramphenicol-sensitive protein RarD